jgi:hypothetical protein
MNSTDEHLKKLLSIVIQGRNDAYMGNFLWRLATCINKHAQNVYELGAQNVVEIVLADWGSDVPLAGALDLEKNSRRLLRVVQVSAAVAAKYNKDSPYSWVHALNTAVRRSRGEYVLISDSDGYMSVKSMELILQGLRKGSLGAHAVEESFFVGSRYHIPKDFHLGGPTIAEIDRFIVAHQPDLPHDKVDMEFFAGGAASYLWSRRIWDSCRGFDERFVHWGWYDIDLFIRLSARYRAVDLEDIGIDTFHLEDYSDAESRKTMSELTRSINQGVCPKAFAANDPQWGLQGEDLPIVFWSDPAGAALAETPVVAVASDDPYFRIVEMARALNVVRVLIVRHGREQQRFVAPLALVTGMKGELMGLARRWCELKRQPISQETVELVKTVMDRADSVFAEISGQEWFLEILGKRDHPIG